MNNNNNKKNVYINFFQDPAKLRNKKETIGSLVLVNNRLSEAQTELQVRCNRGSKFTSLPQQVNQSYPFLQLLRLPRIICWYNLKHGHSEIPENTLTLLLATLRLY